ncbi:hypothetical protein CJ030_MR8G022189 [Morella rubra]|uniref:Uncharacterized protein n=1 Tax=Morella rubra TaxID=262757 RepID=A0A6A1UR74_9ROSI|nr:hypothetical protein CJ030_MR8G022189 [Morella rubra]
MTLPELEKVVPRSSSSKQSFHTQLRNGWVRLCLQRLLYLRWVAPSADGWSEARYGSYYYGYHSQIPTKVRASKRLWVLAQSPPTVEPVKNYGSRYSSPPKVEPVKDYGCRWSSPPKVDPVKDYGYKVEPVKDRGYKAEPMKAYAFKPEPEKDYEYKDVQPKDYGYKVGPVKGYDRPQEVEEFITKIQTDASRPNIGPFNAPYRHQTPQSSGQNGITGYGDKNDSSSKDWRKPSGNTTRNDNYDDYNRKNDTAVESSMVTTQGWARPSPLMWVAPPTRDTTLGTPKTDIATAMENFKKAAKALSVNDAPPNSPFAVPISTVPKRDTISTPPKKDTYAETIDSREAARRYGVNRLEHNRLLRVTRRPLTVKRLPRSTVVHLFLRSK